MRVIPPAPHPRPTRRRLSPLMASLLHAGRDRLGFLARLAEQGDVVWFRLGRRSVLLVSHPAPAARVLRENAGNYRKGIGLVEARAFLGEGMLTTDGNTWEPQRRAAQLAFHGRMESVEAQVAAAAGRLVQRWAGADEVDGVEEAGRAALEVLLTGMFGVGLDGREAEVARAFGVASEYAVGRITAPLAFTARLPTARNRRYREAVDVLRGFADGLLRRPEVAEAGLLPPPVPGGETARRDQVLTLLLAGHETTAAAIAWSWHLLSCHPAAQARVRAEALAVTGVPRAADLPYTTRVVKEAMRLFPPVWVLPRVAAEDDVVGGETVPAGAHVLVSPYTIHRHPGLWSEPDRFDPGRFAPGRAHPAHAYLPFGAGERACVGSRLAMLEAPVLVAAPLARLRVEPRPGHTVRPDALLTLRPRGGLPLRLTEHER